MKMGSTLEGLEFCVSGSVLMDRLRPFLTIAACFHWIETKNDECFLQTCPETIKQMRPWFSEISLIPPYSNVIQLKLWRQRKLRKLQSLNGFVITFCSIAHYRINWSSSLRTSLQRCFELPILKICVRSEPKRKWIKGNIFLAATHRKWMKIKTNKTEEMSSIHN